MWHYGSPIHLQATHPETLSTLSDVCSLLFQKEQYAEAESLYRELVEGQRQTLGSGSVTVLLSMCNLGLCLARLGDLNESGELISQALAAMRNQGDEAISHVQAMVGTLAELRQAQGRLIEAEALYSEAFIGRRKLLGERHPVTLRLCEALAETRKHIDASPKQ